MATESVGQMLFRGSVGVQWKRYLKFGPAKFDEFRIIMWAKHISPIEIHCQLTDVYGRRRDEGAARQKFEICRMVIDDDDWTGGIHTSRLF
jgi:hypothetical protein